MIPANLYRTLSDEQKQRLNMYRWEQLKRVEWWNPEVARVAAEATTEAFQRNPDINLPRSILEAYVVLAICSRSEDAPLTPTQFQHIKSVLDRYGVFRD